MKADNEVFVHAPASKSESMFCRLNLRSMDLSGSASGARDPLTAGQVAAAFAFARIWVPDINQYIKNRRATDEACFDMAMFQHTGNQGSYVRLCHYTLQLVIAMAVAGEWGKQGKGFYTNMTILAVHDVCFPELLRQASARQFAVALALDNHNQWLRVWQPRYKSVCNLLAQLEQVGAETVSRHV